MKKKERQSLIDKIEYEGFEYAFVHYSNFEEIKDEVFHDLRKKYLAARAVLADYVGIE